MSSTRDSETWLDIGGLALVMFIVAWAPFAFAKYDLYRHGRGEGSGFEDLLAGLWLFIFSLVGLVSALASIGRAERKRKSPAFPFLTLMLNFGSFIYLVMRII